MARYSDWLGQVERGLEALEPPVPIDEVEPDDLMAAFKAGAAAESVVAQLGSQPPVSRERTLLPPPKVEPSAASAPPKMESFKVSKGDAASNSGAIGCLMIAILAVVLYGVIRSGSDAPQQADQTSVSTPQPDGPTPEEKAEAAAAEMLEKAKAQVTVVDGWKWGGDGDWVYVRGSIRNGSPFPVTYWVVTVKFFDKNGAVIDSEFTNGIQRLAPGESKRWEIMHPYSRADKQANAEVTEVRFE